MTDLLRDDSDALLRWTLALHGGIASAPPILDEARFARAGLYTGLTALIAAIAMDRGERLPPDWQGFATEQRDQVSRRVDRFVAQLPLVLGALDDARVAAIPVKGAVFVTETWTHWRARPMADIDLIVAPHDRERAGLALQAAGFARLARDENEDTFLLWGDGGVGRRDGESAAHNGKAEIHPGWIERLHGYHIGDGGLVLAQAAPGSLAGTACLRLAPAPFALQVLGHLSACAIRAEVRAVNVVDAALSVGALPAGEREELASLAGRVDPRLVAPGIWLLAQYAHDLDLGVMADDAVARLPRDARSRLVTSAPKALLRSDGGRTTWSWRRAFTMDIAEQLSVARQLALPPSVAGTSARRGRVLARAYAARAGRIVQRATQRP